MKMKFINILCFWLKNLFLFKLRTNKSCEVVIWTLPHTSYIANLIYLALTNYNANLKVQIIVGERIRRFNKDFYFIVCPQMLKKMPPLNKTISIQLEQCVSDWFSKDYFLKLKYSKSIYDYSRSNIRHLLSQGLEWQRVNYFPISAIINYKYFLLERYMYKFEGIKKNDILFYGNLNSVRRQKLLNTLYNNFNVRVEENLYGYEMLKAIDESKIVINLHYYESALLETTRIYECLSMGACVVSESSIDLGDYPHLLNSKQISFFNINDDMDMIKKVESMLSYIDIAQNVIDIKMLEESHNLFQKTVRPTFKTIIG